MRFFLKDLTSAGVLNLEVMRGNISSNMSS